VRNHLPRGDFLRPEVMVKFVEEQPVPVGGLAPEPQVRSPQQRANKQKPKYDGCCRAQHKTEGVVRFKNPLTGAVVIKDLVKGNIVVSNEELDDVIIARSDGTPTYNLTVVVDDMDMKISHVIRGDDHINNTPRQINILNALGVTLPFYAHVPMILGEDGARLSKRHGAASVLQYRDEGYLPEALLNYLVRLGWSHGEQEIFSKAEIVALFSLEKVNVAPSTFNPEKLLWINQQHIMAANPEDLVAPLQWQFDNLSINTEQGPALTDVIAVQQSRAKTMKEMAEVSRYFYEEFETFEAKAAKKNLKAQALPVFEALLLAYEKLDDWSQAPIHQVIKEVTTQLETKMGKVGQPLRVATTGCGLSPSIDVTLALIGKERTLARIKRAIAYIQAQAEEVT